MKKNLLLTFSMILLAVCIFAISVSAVEFGALEEVPGMSEKGKLGAEQRVVLFDGKNYHTYPAYYIFKNEVVSAIDFNALNSALQDTGVSYSISSIVMIEFPEGLTSVGGFEGMTSLEYVQLPKTVASLRGSAFKSCTSLVSVVIPTDSGLTTLNNEVFSGCTALTNITLPEGLTTVGTNTFIGCTSLTSAVVPSTLTTLPTNMFKDCTNLSSITLPSKLKTISKQAFYGCTALKTIDIPDGVESFGESAFASSGITSINLPSSLKEIGKTCFQACSSLACDIVLPEGLESILYRAFFKSGIKSIVIPSTVTEYGSEICAETTSIANVTIHASTIPEKAFYKCSGIKTVTITNAEIINARAFSECTGLSSLSLNEGLETIKTCAFYNSDSLTYVVVPSTVTTMEDKIFESSGVNTAIVKSPVVGSRMFHNAPLSSLTLENTVSIASAAFYSGDFTELVLPETLKSIGDNAFQWCSSMTTITIPGGVETVGTTPFSTCNKLKVVNYTGTNNALLQDILPSGAVISNTNHCETYYNGAHPKFVAIENNTCQGVCEKCGVKTLLDTPVHQNVYTEKFDAQRFFSSVVINVSCKDCERVDLSETIPPLFYWVGYSVKTFGEERGFGQQYIINQDALASYKEIASLYGKKFSYGVVASGASSAGQPLAVLDGVVTNKLGAESISFDNVSYDAFFMNIVGMGEGDLNVSLVCCAYVQLGDEIVYLDNNEAVSTVTLKSYNQIDAIANPKDDEE